MSTRAEMPRPLAEVSEPGDAFPQHVLCPFTCKPRLPVHLHPSRLVEMATLHPHTAIPSSSLSSACQKQIAMGCFPLTPLAVLTYPWGRCKPGCGDEIVIFLFPFLFFKKLSVEFPLPFSADLKKAPSSNIQHLPGARR